MNGQFWEDMYRGRDQVFSGNPNRVLVAEASDLPPGRALDVGCGEGADAIWLARRGWQVTAVDVSETALERAAAAAAEAGVAPGQIEWLNADVAASPPQAGGFDLVSVQYFPLTREPDQNPLPGLMEAVAAGGTLLIGSHDFADLTESATFRPSDYYEPDDIAQILDDTGDWSVLVNEVRPIAETGAPYGDRRHTHDTVLRAERRN